MFAFSSHSLKLNQMCNSTGIKELICRDWDKVNDSKVKQRKGALGMYYACLGAKFN